VELKVRIQLKHLIVCRQAEIYGFVFYSSSARDLTVHHVDREEDIPVTKICARTL